MKRGDPSKNFFDHMWKNLKNFRAHALAFSPTAQRWRVGLEEWILQSGFWLIKTVQPQPERSTYEMMFGWGRTLDPLTWTNERAGASLCSWDETQDGSRAPQEECERTKNACLEGSPSQGWNGTGANPHFPFPPFSRIPGRGAETYSRNSGPQALIYIYSTLCMCTLVPCRLCRVYIYFSFRQSRVHACMVIRRHVAPFLVHVTCPHVVSSRLCVGRVVGRYSRMHIIILLLLDPFSGHIEIECPLAIAMLRDRRKKWGKKRRAPTEAFLSLPFSPQSNLTPHFDPKEGQGVELALWGPFKHCSAPQKT
jgi:hypothetical protein